MAIRAAQNGDAATLGTSTEEWESAIGDQVRALRITANLDQAGLAELAGVSLGAVKAAEQGKGSTLRTLVRLVRALGREEWLDSLAPQPTISPIDVLRSRREPRRRVYRSR
jgi:transcriptional regulator with XRE-family HTH domain